MVGAHAARRRSRRVVTVLGMVVVGGECLDLGLVTRIEVSEFQRTYTN